MPQGGVRAEESRWTPDGAGCTDGHFTSQQNKKKQTGRICNLKLIYDCILGASVDIVFNNDFIVSYF